MTRWQVANSLVMLVFPALCAAQMQTQAPIAEPRYGDGSVVAAAEQDRLYREALQALSEGRNAEAADMLERFLAKEPRHAGAWLDLAISQCELGNASQAERLFAEIERRFAPPPGILEAIARYRATGCGKRAAAPPAWLLSATRGHDNNVNQGARDPRFAIGTGSQLTEYELDPAFLPKANAFSQLSASYLRPLGGGRTTAIVQAYSRWNDRESQQDTASLVGAVEHTWKVRGWQARGTASLGWIALNHALYQRQQQLQARLTPPLPLPEGLEFALSGSLSRVNYPTRPSYDGDTVELGTIATYRGKRELLQATVTRLRDNSASGRPGGDRDGWFGSLQWYGETSSRLTLEAGLSHQFWHSDEIYSAGVIETRRRQNMTTARIGGQWSLRPHTSLVLEWRQTLNRENISLFQYNSRVLQLSLRWDNF